MFRFLLPALMASSALVTPVLAQQASPDQPMTVDDIVVTGRAQRLYRTPETTVGRTVEAPLNIPQAVQVLNAELIADLGARDVTDLYRNISGVSFFSYSGITFRGFRQDTAYYDGLRGNPFVGFSVPKLFNIEQVEVLKGPAGMLYGPGSPGGTINYVTKTPSDVFSGKVTAVAGNYDRIGASGEVTGPIDADGRFTYRAGGFYEDRDSFRRNAGDRSIIGDFGLGARIDERTDLTVQATVYDQELAANRLRGVPVDRDGNFLTDITWNHNEPSDYLNLDAQVYQARLKSRLAEGITADLSARYFQYTEDQQYHESRGLIDTDRDGRVDTIRREFRDQHRETEALSIGGNVSAQTRLFGLKHKLLGGADWIRQDDLFAGRTALDSGRRGPVPNLSLFNPVYGLTSGANYNLLAIPLNRTDDRAIRWGVYLQDQIALGENWIVVGGVRRDTFEDENLVSGASVEDAATTYRLGLIYKPREDVSVYASASDTFEPQAAASQNPAVGGPFEPITGSQIEGGVKTALFNGRLQANLAIYRIVRANLVQTDTSRAPVNGLDQLAPIGEVTSEGGEIDIAADLTADWVVTLNYGYNDTIITDTVAGQSLSNAVGNRFANAPRHKIGLWSRYEVDALDAAIALGAEYVSERVGLDGERVKPYTLFDASLMKSFGPVEVMVRIDNLFDKTYAASGFGLRNGSFPGEPRTWFVEVSRSF